MTIIDIQDMSFKYKDENILEHLSLQEDEPMIVGLWGRNGSGKTTLMKLISGQERPDAGHLSVLDKKPFNNTSATEEITILGNHGQ